MTALEIVKKFRQLWRLDDGTAMYECLNAESGAGLLLADQNEPLLGPSHRSSGGGASPRRLLPIRTC